MALPSPLAAFGGPRPRTAQARSTTRLALVAATLLATLAILVFVTLEARSAERALEESAQHTIIDYTGYAGRILGAEVLRRFNEQRAQILAPVAGSSGRHVPAPALSEIESLGDPYFAQLTGQRTTKLGYFKLDLFTHKVERTGNLSPTLERSIADTLTAIHHAHADTTAVQVLALSDSGVSHSVAYAPLRDEHGETIAVYGYTYNRADGISAVARQVFAQTPLLPTSLTGARWNYDTSRVERTALNDSILGMRILDRGGHVLWRSDGTPFDSTSAYGQRIVISTFAGGFIVETTLRRAAVQLLIPGAVRQAQQWFMWALIALALLLAMVSLFALQGERSGAKQRRTEALQQLALGLRHELNNALASLLLNAELLAEDAGKDESQRERVDSIVEQAERMRSVLRRLEKADQLDNVVPYLNDGLMVDLSSTAPHETFTARRS